MYIFKSKSFVPVLLFLICITQILPSCTHYQHFSYFEDVSDTSKPVLQKTSAFVTPTIQKGDLLSITIQTLDNDITTLLNSNNSINGSASSIPVVGVSSSAPSGQSVANGFLVDNNGNVELAFVGTVHLEGLTTLQAKDAVRKEVSKYFNNAVINVRFANFRVTVLGEVTRPSTFIVPNEKINLFDALGMAGDITVFGRKDNVVLIRDSMDEKKIIRFNLNSKDIISSPWFYLQPNDVVYVPANKYKIASVDAVRNRDITIIAAGLSLLTIIFSRVIK